MLKALASLQLLSILASMGSPVSAQFELKRKKQGTERTRTSGEKYKPVRITTAMRRWKGTTKRKNESNKHILVIGFRGSVFIKRQSFVEWVSFHFLQRLQVHIEHPQSLRPLQIRSNSCSRTISLKAKIIIQNLRCLGRADHAFSKSQKLQKKYQKTTSSFSKIYFKITISVPIAPLSDANRFVFCVF